MNAWAHIENIVTLLLACGMVVFFFPNVGWVALFWLLLLINLNFPKTKK